MPCEGALYGKSEHAPGGVFRLQRVAVWGVAPTRF